ncbi:MAG TPA: outer membrane beta-barrel domain-containing protein [Myxococcaceae bacterium]|nr:outer membrane beta-barrel domain-containing protein [Myxococcaceae bacterium]
MSCPRVLAIAGLLAFLAFPARDAHATPEPVQPRLYPVGGRFSLAATVGISVFDTLTRTGTLEVRAGWDFNEWLGLDASVTGALAGHTALADRVGQHLLQTPPVGTVDDLSDLWELKAMVLGGVRLAPVYGKFNLGPDLPIRYQAYLWLGGGAAWLDRTSVAICRNVTSREEGTCGDWFTESRVTPAVSAALGFRIFTGVHGAVLLELRSIVWKDDYLLGVDRAAAEAGNVGGRRAPSPGFTNTMLIQLGYAFIF